jgi:hypothetical protein
MAYFIATSPNKRIHLKGMQAEKINSPNYSLSNKLVEPQQVCCLELLATG